MTTRRSTGPTRLVATARSIAEAIGIRRTIVVVVVALLSGTVVLLIERYLGSEHEWNWDGALADFVKLFATTIIIVGLLDWYRQRRWHRAEGSDLTSLTLMAHLVATGWSSPKNVGTPDLDPAVVNQQLAKEITKLREASARLDALYGRLRTEPGIMELIELDSERWSFSAYYAEGSRSRRLHYLSVLLEAHLPGLIERRDDPELFARFVALRDTAVQAGAAADHADAVIRERVLVDRPPILEDYLNRQNALSAFDPVAILAFAIENAVRALETRASLPEGFPEELEFATRCVGAVRNELQWVEDALRMLHEVIETLEDDIREVRKRDAPRGASHPTSA
jgi:hypothetical protein